MQQPSLETDKCVSLLDNLLKLRSIRPIRRDIQIRSTGTVAVTYDTHTYFTPWGPSIVYTTAQELPSDSQLDHARDASPDSHYLALTLNQENFVFQFQRGMHTKIKEFELGNSWLSIREQNEQFSLCPTQDFSQVGLEKIFEPGTEPLVGLNRMGNVLRVDQSKAIKDILSGTHEIYTDDSVPGIYPYVLLNTHGKLLKAQNAIASLCHEYVVSLDHR